jgi:hypothetical protein
LSRKKNFTCRAYDCEEPPYLGGLCEKHHEEKSKKERRRNAAIDALHYLTIDGEYLENSSLQEKLLNIKKWWDRACISVNHRITDNILLDEANYALEWCIALAQEIVDAELAYRKNKDVPENLQYVLQHTEDMVLDRFKNLEAGLMSNGVARPKPRNN